MNLKKTITLTISGHEYEVDVNFRIIEIAETVYQASADHIIATLLTNPRAVQRTSVAHTISQWVDPPKGMKRSAIYEAVITANAADMAVYVGCIQGAIAYALRYIDDEGLDTLTKGEDLPDEPKEKGRAAPLVEPSSETATG